MLALLCAACMHCRAIAFAGASPFAADPPTHTRTHALLPAITVNNMPLVSIFFLQGVRAEGAWGP
jgi:hypothetical protein